MNPARGGTADPRRARRRPPPATLALAAAVVLLAGACASGVPDSATDETAPLASRIAPAGPDPTPAQLVGLDADQLDRLLGTPDFTRADGPAQIRQYREAGCVLDVFLYSDSAGSYRVTHVDGRERVLSGGDAAPACVSSLIHTRRLRAAS